MILFLNFDLFISLIVVAIFESYCLRDEKKNQGMRVM